MVQKYNPLPKEYCVYFWYIKCQKYFLSICILIALLVFMSDLSTFPLINTFIIIIFIIFVIASLPIQAKQQAYVAN